MLEMLKEILQAIVADDEIFDLNAKAMRKMHQALVKNGFTEEQATQIVASQGHGIKAS
jgi:hypothetical protein